MTPYPRLRPINLAQAFLFGVLVGSWTTRLLMEAFR